MTRSKILAAAACSLFLRAANCATATSQNMEWKPVEGRIMTRWARQITPDKVWPEYPRPQMVRRNWQNLNGLWDYAITPREAGRPTRFEGKILVPFPCESALSGVGRSVTPDQRLWYRRSFSIPPSWRDGRLLLHFGAVDWQATVTVNGKQVGEHKGGYTPFSFDITDALVPATSQELVVSVWDPTDSYTQPRGKQSLKPEGIWYTAVTGIWQTVWLEPVPKASIRHLSPVPDVDHNRLLLTVVTTGASEGLRVRAEATDGGQAVAQAEGKPGEKLSLSLPSPRLWSPESPHLYDLKVSLWSGRAKLDEVSSYFGMRKISLGQDQHGHTRILLNGRPYFHIGPLDQGWWPDGLYTAPSDEALRYDIEVTRQLGFNAVRKHVKVEPARWYYHCDRLGLLVWQDMPSGCLPRGVPNSLRILPGQPDAMRDSTSAALFEEELRQMVLHLGHFPSIGMWAPFNEGWGQYDTARITQFVKELDPSRLVDAASGWTDRGVGDVIDAHVYTGPGMEPPESKRASVVGEYGGLGLPVKGHLWMTDKNWGYQSFADTTALEQEYLRVTGALRGMLGLGLSAAIYTQTTDVEGEVNGLLTYDRAVIKFSPHKLLALHDRLKKESGLAKVLAPDSSFHPQSWLYTFEEPPAGWERPGADTTRWKQGEGGFGTDDGGRFRSGTPWETPQVWMRREFTSPVSETPLFLTVFHNVTDCEVFLNGARIYQAHHPRAAKRHYTHVDVSEFASWLKKGPNVIAVRAKKEKGPRSIDVGLYTLLSGGKHP